MHHAGQEVIDNLEVTSADRVPEPARAYALAKMGALAKYAPGPVDSADVRLTTTADRRVAPVVVAHAHLRVKGTDVNAEAEADTFTEAIDLLHDRVRRLLLKVHN